jgi:hypothetical protein
MRKALWWERHRKRPLEILRSRWMISKYVSEKQNGMRETFIWLRMETNGGM